MLTSLFLVNKEICSKALMTLIKHNTVYNAALRWLTAFFGLSAHQKTWKCYTKWMEHENISPSAFTGAAITYSLLACRTNSTRAIWCVRNSGTSDRICSSHLPVLVSTAGGKPIQSPRCDRGWDPGIAESWHRGGGKRRLVYLILLIRPSVMQRTGWHDQLGRILEAGAK